MALTRMQARFSAALLAGALGFTAPARADDGVAIHPFIRHIAGLAFYADAAPRCGLRSNRWAADLLSAIGTIIDRTRDGNPANAPASAEFDGAVVHLLAAHDVAAVSIEGNPAVMCAHAELSAGLRDADGLVRRRRDGRL
jgi:hypothetical protein